ncbi:MAG: transglutaminase-like cysteine peptidase [Cellvibrionaceae bacterium]|nr:transglutaminase-like cysteine peptidase [Cellvibrionaceae bacterium]
MPNYRDLSDTVIATFEQRYGAQAGERIRTWRRLLDKLAAQLPADDLQQLTAANAYFNRVEWKWDIDHWGQQDYWATPLETLASNAGDCEDFSIGKYFSLIGAGMQTHKLRITYVKALTHNVAHMVLAYYPHPAAEPLILDNINKTILPASARQDLLPIYSFNGDGLWLAKSRARPQRADPAVSLPSWARLRGRVQAELAH